MASSHRGVGSLVPTPRARLSPVFVWASLHKQCNVGASAACARARGGCAPAHVYLWSDPAEGYLLFNLFVEVPACQRPHLLQAPEWGAWRCVDPRS